MRLIQNKWRAWTNVSEDKFEHYNLVVVIESTSVNSDSIISTDSNDDPNEQYEQTETYFVKLSGQNAVDLKIEHFDDMLQDNSIQTSWAGLDSTLIDEDFLYLEDEEADRVYKELK